MQQKHNRYVHQRPHMLITSCAHMRQLCKYIYLIQTEHNEKCDHDHQYTFISHFWHMPLNKYACDIAHTCPTALQLWSKYRLHIDPTLLYIQVQKNVQEVVYILLYMCPTNMPLKCHIYKVVHVQISAKYVSIYTSYELNVINSVTSSTAIHTFHIIGTCPSTNTPATTHTLCPNALIQ